MTLSLRKDLWPKFRRLMTDPVHLKNLLSWLAPLFVKGGVRAIVHAKRDQLVRLEETKNYSRWIQTYDSLSESDKAAISRRLSTLKYQPLISVIMPVYNVDEKWLRLAIESVRNQIYPNWELCIADDHSTKPHIRSVLEEYQALDSRIRVIFRNSTGHISLATNSALEIAQGEFFAFLDHDDELTIHALYWVIEELNAHPEADLIYSDEDKINERGDRFSPHFKSDWNLDLFHCLNLVTHLAVYRASLVRALGGLRKGYEGSQDYDLVCRVLTKTDESKIRHIPQILYHWRAIQGSTALNPDQKLYTADAARRAIQDHLNHRGIRAEVKVGDGPLNRVQYSLPESLPYVSLLVPTMRSSTTTLKKLTQDILKNTRYRSASIEVIYTSPEDLGLSSQLNAAARKASGEIFIFMNPLLRTASSDWLEELVSQALRPEVGAVAPKIYFKDKTILGSGIALSKEGICGLIDHRESVYLTGNLGHTVCVQSIAAATLDCLAVRKETFEKVSGLDEGDFKNGYFDADFCMKIRSLGLRVVWTPFSKICLDGQPLPPWNKESFADDLKSENKTFVEKWNDRLDQVLYYSPNFSLHPPSLTLAFPPRTAKPWK